MLMRRALPLLVLALALAAPPLQAAKRLGGGTSIGRQSANVTQREAARPPAAPAPAQQQAAPASPSPAPAAPAPATGRPWGGMLGGLAAGLGLAWLANSLGLGPAFGGLVVVLLLVTAGLAVAAAIARSRRGALQPAGHPADIAALPRQYSPDKVGNDASARPWERNSMALEVPSAPQPPQIGAGLAGGGTWAVPAGFDVEGFVAHAKQNFMVLQEAWDRADLPLLRSMMTDAMLEDIKAQLAERERQPGAQPNRTEVAMLQAQLLGIEDLGTEYLASVEFSGMVREDPSAGPAPFREVWNMSKPKDGASGWLVAGVQALQ